MATSWVADTMVMASANTAIAAAECVGSCSPISTTAGTISAWQTSSHDRRWPSTPCSHGMRSRSTSGAHRKLIAYGVATDPNRPIEVREIPSSRSQIDSVANTSDDGNPLAMPNRKMMR